MITKDCTIKSKIGFTVKSLQLEELSDIVFFPNPEGFALSGKSYSLIRIFLKASFMLLPINR